MRPQLLLLLGLALQASPASGQEGTSIFAAIPPTRSATIGSADGELMETDLLDPDGRHFQVWVLEPGVPRELRIDLRSADFDSHLRLVGPGLGAGLVDDDSGDGFDARLCTTLPEEGEYRLVLASLGGSGSFALDLAADGGTSCEDPVEPTDEVVDPNELPTEGRFLAMGSEQNGTLTASDPIFVGSPAQAWELPGRAGRSITIDQISDVFDSYLFVVGPGLEELSDDDSGGGCHARITFTFPEDGVYRVIASAISSDATGPYVLAASETPRPPQSGDCGYGAADVDENLGIAPVVGTLSPGDRVEGTISADSVGVFNWHAWNLEAAAGSRLTIDAETSAFDAYLMFDGPGFPEPMTDDDSGENLNARLCIEIPTTDVYRVIVRPRDAPSGDAPYALSVTEGAQTGCELYRPAPAIVARMLAGLDVQGREIAVGEERMGTLTADAPTHPESGHPIQPWMLRGEPGQRVFVDVLSDEFDVLLYTLDQVSESVLFNDDTGDGCNARIETNIASDGQLTLFAGAYTAGATGDYRVRVTVTPEPIGTGGCENRPAVAGDSLLARLDPGTRVLELGSEIEGLLSEGDSRISNQALAEAWRFSGVEGDEVIFEVASGVFDPVLYVYGPGLPEPLMDDDGGTGTDSRVVVTLPASGTFTLVVAGLNDEQSGIFYLRALRRAR